MNLNNRDWKPFKLISDKLFYLDDCKTLKSTSIANDSGVHDVVGATSKNNGNVGFVSDDYKDLLVNGNCICLIKTGEGSVGDAVYKNGSFIPSNNVAVIRSKYLNKYNAQFIVGEINKQSIRYNYGYIRNNARINKEILLLPCKKEDENQPDWEFMEQYVKHVMKSKKEVYKKYIFKKIEEMQYKQIPNLEDKKWEKVKLCDICDINSGQDIYEKERITGITPYITSTSSNNGIKYFVSNSNNTLDSNAISVNRNGSVGYAFYHKYDALYSNDCRKLKLKKHANEYVALFLTNQIMQQKEKYSYGYKMGTARLKKQYIMLPFNDNGEPDYPYMEQYIKNMILTKYQQYR